MSISSSLPLRLEVLGDEAQDELTLLALQCLKQSLTEEWVSFITQEVETERMVSLIH